MLGRIDQRANENRLIDRWLIIEGDRASALLLLLRNLKKMVRNTETCWVRVFWNDGSMEPPLTSLSDRWPISVAASFRRFLHDILAVADVTVGGGGRGGACEELKRDSPPLTSSTADRWPISVNVATFFPRRFYGNGRFLWNRLSFPLSLKMTIRPTRVAKTR